MNARFAGIASIAVAAAALGVATWLFLDSRTPAPPEIGGYVLEAPRTLPAFELVDELGASFRSSDFAGHWSFLYFGYTYCPDVCPLTLVTLAAVKKQIAAEQPALRAAYYLVSVDPKRDTPARLREYVTYFDSELRGLTGSSPALAAFANATETVYDVPEGEDDDNYLVSHSSNVVLLDPNGHLHAIFTPPHDPTRLVADFTEIAARFPAAR